MRRITLCFLVCVLVLVAFQGNGLAQTTILHSFSGSPGDGGGPQYGGLVSDGSAFYGTTVSGGANNVGTIYKINIDGSGYELLHEFAGPPSDGTLPYGSLILSGSTLYGMAYAGGLNNAGILYAINTDGTGYTALHDFGGGAGDGSSPYGELLLIGSRLYGTAYLGGVNNAGVIFAINTDGTGYALLREFAGGAGDGAYPFGALINDGSTLYGMTRYGGATYNGVIFKINTDGSGFEVLHEFAGGTTDGAFPQGSLILDGSNLYGMTIFGGAGLGGVIFRIATDGTGYELLHEFAGAPDDGDGPHGSFILDGATLYGMTAYGGPEDYGTIFKINADGSEYETLYEFAGTSDDGATPLGDVVLIGSTLYGYTVNGGADDHGVIFSLELQEEPTTAQPIPTLSEWGVIVLALLLALAAMLVLRRNTLKPGRTA